MGFVPIRSDGVGHEAEIDERSFVAVTFLELRRRSSVSDHGHRHRGRASHALEVVSNHERGGGTLPSR